MISILNLAQAESGGDIQRLISPLLILALIWTLFTLWAGLVLFLPRRGKSEDEFDEDKDILAEYEGAGAKAAGVVLYLAAISIVILAGTYVEVPALIAASALCLAGLVIAYMVKVQVRASRVALGASVMGAILGGIIIAQYTIRNLWMEPEKHAANMIKQLQAAEEKFYYRWGEVGKVSDLGPKSYARGPKLENDRYHGYIFTIESHIDFRWTITARPDSYFSGILAHFFVDGNSGKVRFSRGQPARLTSPTWVPPKKQ